MLRNAAILQLEDTDAQDLLTQYHINCTEEEKYLLILFMFKLRVHPFGSNKTILFVNSIEKCYKLRLFLEQFGIKSCCLNSELPVKSRYHIVQEFNRGIYDFIICTDEGGSFEMPVEESDDEADVKETEEPKIAEIEDDGEAEVDEPKVEAVEEVVEMTVDAVQDAEENEEIIADEPAVEEPDVEEPVTEEPVAKTKKGKKGKGKKFKADGDFGVSRGIDFKNVTAVINFDMPQSSRSYQHRVGRTARGVGNKGYALSFVCTDIAPTVIHTRKKSKINASQYTKVKVQSDEQVLARIEKRQECIL